MADALGLGYIANLALGVALVLLAFTLLGGGARRGNAWLAIMLALVGANYFLDALRVVARALGGGFRADALVFATSILDPAFLLLFALAASGIVLRPAWTIGILAGPFLFVAAHLGADAAGYVLPWAGAVRTWGTILVYGASFAILARAWLRERDAVDRDRLGALVVAMSVVALARVPLAYVDLGLAPGITGRAQPTTLVLEAGLALAFGAFALATRRAAPADAWPARWPVVRRVALLLAVVASTWLLRFVPGVQDAAFALLYSVRWFLFVGVLALLVERGEGLALPRRSRLPLRALAAVLFAFLAIAVVAALLTSPRTELWVTLVGGAMLAGVGALVALAARSLLPPSGPLGWRKLSLYRAQVELGVSREELERTAAELGLLRRDAEDVEAQVRLARSLPPLAATLAPGTLFHGRYEVLELKGAGSFGRVFTARDRMIGENVVLKELLAPWQEDAEAVERFRREAEVALRVRHPGLVGFHGIERAGAAHVLVLDEVDGVTLRERLARGPLSEEEAGRIARDLLGGLAALHAHGILHRDVKPENIMVPPAGGAVLLDFGAAGAAREGTRLAGGRPHPGTPFYMSPEQRAGRELTPASDLYSAGAVLWEALAGVPPPRGAVPQRWRAALERALAEEPAKRPASADELAALLGVS